MLSWPQCLSANLLISTCARRHCETDGLLGRLGVSPTPFRPESLLVQIGKSLVAGVGMRWSPPHDLQAL